MSTPNFYITGTKPFVYAVLVPKQDENGNFHQFEQEDYEEFVNSIEAEISTFPNSIHTGMRDKYELRSYSSKVLGSLYADKKIFDDEFTVYVTAVLRMGYFQAANLDYQVHWFLGRDDVSDIELIYLPEILRSNYGCSQKRAELESGRLIGFINKAEKKLKLQMINIFESFCDQKLRLEGVFSNGQAVYSKIK